MEEVLRAAISTALRDEGLPEATFSVEHPADLSHGDYATNVALIVAKQAGKNPRELAQALTESLVAARIPHVEGVAVAGPGFINFTLAREFFIETTKRVLAEDTRWGAGSELAGETILLDYTSPNLFKPLHIGNLVGNIIGESLARTFVHVGASVKRINYPSDIGLTVAKGVWGLWKTGGNPEDIHALGDAYRRGNEAYENDAAAKQEIERINQALYQGTDAKFASLRSAGIGTSLRHLTDLCRMLGTTFDLQVFESDAGPVGKAIVEKHTPGVFEESEGAVVFRGEKVGLHTRVFLNSQGLPTYEAKDLGNFVIKQREFPDWTQYVVVTGSEQRDYFKVVFAALREVFPEYSGRSFEHIPTGFLTLTTGKMSSRAGNVLTGESLIGEMRERARERAAESRTDDLEGLTTDIAVAALKYQVVRQASGSDIVFDKEQALSFEGASGPYLQYTAVRARSVIEKAAALGIVPEVSAPRAEPYDLERLLYRFPEMVLRSAREREPHHITTFLTELAGRFNAFYAGERIADATDQHAPYKVALTTAVGVTLRVGLDLLGIPVPEKM